MKKKCSLHWPLNLGYFVSNKDTKTPAKACVQAPLAVRFIEAKYEPQAS